MGRSTKRYEAPANAKVAALFESRPGEWIDGRVVAEIAGLYGWRTRISEVRRQYGMNIENRQFKRGRYTVSEYRYLPVVSEGCGYAA